MKTQVPEVFTGVWKNLYAAAAAFRSLRPWEVLDDLDLIGVRDSSTNETGYGVVMGSGGTIFGLCLYRGAEGFDFYRHVIDGDIDGTDGESFAMLNCLMLEFGRRSELQAEDLAIIRQLGLSFKGRNAWPRFRSLLPNYAPWFLTEDEARFLTLSLDVVSHHCEKVEKGEAEESLRDNACLVYSRVDGLPAQYTARWEPLPNLASTPTIVPLLDLTRINAILAQKPKPDSPWEAAVFCLPHTIHERGRPYYIRMAVVCQQSSGFIFTAEISPPERLAPQLLAEAICRSVERHGFLADTIFVKRKEEATALTPLAKALGIAIRVKEPLNTIEMIKEDLTERFAYGKEKKLR